MPRLLVFDFDENDLADRPVLEWDELPSLKRVFQHERKFYDEDVTAELDEVVRRILTDVPQIGGEYLNPFVWDLAGKDIDFLTAGQARGVLNCISSSIRGQRKRFWKSRDTRIDGDSGFISCIICGGPLTGYEPVARACGDVCYSRILGDWDRKVCR